MTTDRIETPSVLSKGKSSTKWKALIFIVLIIACVVMAFFLPIAKLRKIEALREWLRSLGGWAYLGYVAAFLLGELLFLPRMVLITAGGLALGPLAGGVLSLLADMIAGTAFYLAATSLARPAVEAMLRRRPRIEMLVKLAARRHGTLMVALLRICPMAHYTVFSYACGLFDLPIRPYLLGTFIGILPGAALYPFLGNAVLNPGSAAFFLAAASLLLFLLGTFWLSRRLIGMASREEMEASLRSPGK